MLVELYTQLVDENPENMAEPYYEKKYLFRHIVERFEHRSRQSL